MTAIFGMQGTGRWSDSERPQNWRQTLLYLYPRGAAKVTAIMSKAAKEKTGDPVFHWWEKDSAAMAGSFTAGQIYTNQAMTSALNVHNSTVGTILHIKIDGTASDPVTNYVQDGSDVLITKTDDYRICVRANVIGVDRGGGTACRITVRLLTNDSGDSEFSLTSANRIIVMPKPFAELGGVPEPISYKPVEYYNYTQIVKESLAMSRTALGVKDLRPGTNDYNEAKRETLYNLGVKMEFQTIFGVRSSSTDPVTGQPIRRSMGIRQYIETYAPSTNISSFKFDPEFAGLSWEQGGWDWMIERFRILSTYCDLSSTLNLVGSGVLAGLAKTAKTGSTINLSSRDTDYGISVKTLVTPFGDLNLVDHPLFNREPALQYLWIGIPQNAMVFRTISDPDYGNSDVRFLPDPNYGKGGANHIDGRFDLYLAEYGYEFQRSKEWFMLYDVGRDNAL